MAKEDIRKLSKLTGKKASDPESLKKNIALCYGSAAPAPGRYKSE
jgi:hypothetical protein